MDGKRNTSDTGRQEFFTPSQESPSHLHFLSPPPRFIFLLHQFAFTPVNVVPTLNQTLYHSNLIHLAAFLHLTEPNVHLEPSICVMKVLLDLPGPTGEEHGILGVLIQLMQPRGI